MSDNGNGDLGVRSSTVGRAHIPALKALRHLIFVSRSFQKRNNAAAQSSKLTIFPLSLKCTLDASPYADTVTAAMPISYYYDDSICDVGRAG